MAWITTIDQDQAAGKLLEIYDEIRKMPAMGGMVPNIMKAFSSRPELLQHISRAFSTATFGGSRLSRPQEEMIATVVSSLNRCHY